MPADSRFRRPPVHPRLCGEHTGPGTNNDLPFGSSPPVRGTLSPAENNCSQDRFIPACAGNTECVSMKPISFAVHPRLCGEHSTCWQQCGSRSGSSPPVRGTRAQSHQQHSVLRFIPACAGNTTTAMRKNWPFSVHPRLCGEHSSEAANDRLRDGSSPPVRGTRGGGRSPRLSLRFIPACAGNTRIHHAFPRRLPVHPRLCGEHSSHKILKNKDFRDQQMRTSFSSYVLHVDEGFQTCLSARLGGCLIDNSWQGRKTHELETVEIDGNAAIDTTGVEVITEVLHFALSAIRSRLSQDSLDL